LNARRVPPDAQVTGTYILTRFHPDSREQICPVLEILGGSKRDRVRASDGVFARSQLRSGAGTRIFIHKQPLAASAFGHARQPANDIAQLLVCLLVTELPSPFIHLDKSVTPKDIGSQFHAFNGSNRYDPLIGFDAQERYGSGLRICLGVPEKVEHSAIVKVHAADNQIDAFIKQQLGICHGRAES
jgi:hypothetical protein